MMWHLYTMELDYKKIVFVLPSSKRISSPYSYKRCGDFFLAKDLKAGFEKLGYNVEYRFREDYDNLNLGDAGNVIYFKGYYVYKKIPKDFVWKRKNILYVYYMEGLSPYLLQDADVVVSASEKFIEHHVKPKGLKGYVVPQFTNPERFKNDGVEEDKKTEVLFVGSNNYGADRLSVKYAKELGLNLSLYGKQWNKKEYADVLKADFVDNDELHKYYTNAKIVLNDHRAEMAYYGFVSNRIYDVSASGGFIFTDYVQEIEQAYGDSIAMYKNFDEFKEKVVYYLEHEEERKEMIKKAQEITLKEFTNIRAAEKFDLILKNIIK
ncbi:MAG: glycosyltransferase family 1 protein [Alphaproteobacteria bacterium]|nr:glycosyltransferase family 1 protein [Alphaproteobacteria bacterium]